MGTDILTPELADLPTTKIQEIDMNYRIDLPNRPRRNRVSPAIRSLCQETHLHPSQLIAPLFVLDGEGQEEEIHSMPGVFRRSIDLHLKELEYLYQKGMRVVDLFFVIPNEKKNLTGSESRNSHGLMARTIRKLKQEMPDLCVMADIALDPFTSHGHDGIIDHLGRGTILNDPTLQALEYMTLTAANAGVDWIAPSDMMDGRVGYLRKALDRNGFTDIGILAYTAKYASGFYGPFRDALHSAPKFGDKKTYQMNPANIREAIREARLDEAEGADMLMVKPGLPYLDVIAKLKEISPLPISAYHVSGEYAMVKAAGRNGWIDEDRVFYESMISLRRAGADFILTYAARQIIDSIANGIRAAYGR
jgi:porphobilinogen synthase